MASEVDGFADLVSKLDSAVKLAAKLDDSLASAAKNASKLGDAVGGATTSMGSKGGQKDLGKGKSKPVGGTGAAIPSTGMTGKQTTGALGLGAFGAAATALGNKIGKESSFGGFATKIGTAATNQSARGGIFDPISGMQQRPRKIDGERPEGPTRSLFQTLSPQQQERIGSSMYGLSDSLTLFKNLSAASSSFMPSINDTMNRATRYYNATMYGGNQMSRKETQAATYETMKGLNGITSAGSDASVAQFLSARGMAPQKGEGVYQQTIRTVANAARYMNISNEDAVRSVEGLTNARGAADMLRNFGIYTADLKTGKEKTQTEIFEELAGRLTAGRGKATVEQTQKSIRRGSLGVTVDAFFGGDQQSAQMFKQYMIDRAGGGAKDLSGKNRIETSGANKNPLESQMTIAAKQTGALGSAEDQYIAGIRTATGALGALTDVAGGLASLMGGANALIQTLMGNEQFKGAVGGLTSIVDFGSKGLAGVFNAARQMNPAGWTEAGIIGASMGVTLGAAAGIGLGAQAVSQIGAVQGTGGAANTAVTGMSGMSIGTSVINSGGTGGSDVASSFSMGDYSKTPGMSDTATDNSGPLFSVDWLASYRKTSEYGVSDAAHQESPHRGTDFAMPTGSEVKAVGDGTVVDTRTGIGNTWGQGERASGSTGNMIRIQHTGSDGKTYYSWYLHLSEVLVSKGQTVTKGQVIGRSGNTGNSTGPHLHLEFQDENKKAIPYTTALALIGGKNAAASQEFGMSKETLAAGMKFTKQNAQLPTQSADAFNILKGLYSGDTAQILASIGAMAPGMGITPDDLSRYINAPDVSLVSPSAPGSAATGNGVNNNVSITVQVPDVTSADALKFAQLVRSYLQNDTLMSTTGSV